MSDPRTILISGATGLVGGRLVASLLERGIGVRALTRNVRSAGERLDPAVVLVRWDGRAVPEEAVRGVGGVVHLAGEPVFGGLLTSERKQKIRDSRIVSTRSLVAAIERTAPEERPGVLVCASAVGYYGDCGNEKLTEAAAPGSGFLAEVCVGWEEAARAAEAHGVRTVSLRTGIVLAREGGALPLMARPFRIGLGGRLGSGRQWFPWIHIDDLVSLALEALADPAYRGPVNAVAPHPVPNAEFTASLGRALGRPTLLPVPGFVIRAALGELADELLGSRRVVPEVAAERDFGFRYTQIDAALAAEL